MINRLTNFVNKYKQGEVKLSKDEKKLEEKTSYTYFYNCDKFIYSYIFSSSYNYEGLERHKHYETSYIIDENGNAL